MRRPTPKHRRKIAGTKDHDRHGSGTGADELLIDVYVTRTGARYHAIYSCPGILDVLPRLREQGRRLGIVTAKRQATVQLAFANSGMPPNAVPTTFIMDREGRVAGRISGLISDQSILAAMIDRVLEEG